MALVDVSKFGPLFNTLFRNDIQGSAQGPPTSPAITTVARDIGTMLSELNTGAVANALLELSVQPTTGDTFTIDGLVFEFVTAAGNVATNTNVGIPIGAAVANSRTNAIAAINGTATVPSGLFQTDGTTAAIPNNTTKNWVCDLVDTTYMRIRSADAPGGNVVSRADTSVVSSTLTNAANIWDVGTGNAVNNGRAVGTVNISAQKRAITAAMITFGSGRYSFGSPDDTASAITGVIVQVRASTGVNKFAWADVVAISDRDVEITYTGGGTDIAATDTVTVIAFT